MPNKLFLKPAAPEFNHESSFFWALYDLTGAQLKYGQSSTLEEIDQTLMQNGIDAAEAILVWPSDWAFTTKVSIPGNQTRYIQQALPFVIEEQVAQDIEQLHFSVGAKSADGLYPVVSIDYALFESCVDLIVDQLESAHLKLAYLDAQILPLADAQAAVYLSENAALVRFGEDKIIRLNNANLMAYLELVFGDEDVEASINVIDGTSGASNMLIAEIEQLPEVEVRVQGTELSELEVLCEGFFSDSKSAINLFQGDFKISASSNNSWKKWRAVAVIAGLGFFLQIGLFVGKGVYYQQQAEVIGEQALSQYQKIVPGNQSISVEKLPRIIKGKLNQLRTQPSQDVDFLTLLGEAGLQFNKTPNKAQLSFKSITYNEQRGELIMEMQAGSFDQLESLKKAIVDAGLSAKISSAVQEDNYYRGRISVSGS